MSEQLWEVKTIASLLSDHFAGEWGTEPQPGNALVLRSTDITTDGKLNVNAGAERRIPAAKLTAKRLKAGDILLENSGGSPDQPVGRVAFFEEQHSASYICSNFFRTLRPNLDQADPRFLLWKLLWFYGQPRLLQLQQQTTGIINLKIKEYLESAIEVPAQTNEQKRIAKILDTLDTAIQRTGAIIGKLRQVKQGLLHDLLTRGIDANGDLRPSADEAPDLYQDSPVGRIPKAWGVAPLSSFTLTDITYGIVQAGPHVPGGVPYIRTGDMSGERLVREHMLCTSRRIADSFKRSEVRAGEIVMAIRATVGKVLPVPPDLDGANLTQGTARIAPNEQTNGSFLLWAIRHGRCQQAISDQIKGTTFSEITLAALRQIPLAAPKDKDEQKVIGDRLSEIDRRGDVEAHDRDKLLKLKSGLMDDLLTGRVRVTALRADGA